MPVEERTCIVLDSGSVLEILLDDWWYREMCDDHVLITCSLLLYLLYVIRLFLMRLCSLLTLLFASFQYVHSFQPCVYRPDRYSHWDNRDGDP